MINLLSPSDKIEILLKKRSKLILIFELGLLLFLISLSLVLSSVLIYLNGEIKAEKINVAEREKDIDLAKIADFQKNIGLLNNEIKNINSFYGRQTHLTDLLEKVYAKLPAGSYLNSFSFSKTSQTLNLSGFAKTREDLLNFKRSIEADPKFKNVNFPPGNWVSQTDIEFYLSFELK